LIGRLVRRRDKIADRRDLTDVAKEITNLSLDTHAEKNGRDVTLVQLTDLFKGRKKKAAMKMTSVLGPLCKLIFVLQRSFERAA